MSPALNGVLKKSRVKTASPCRIGTPPPGAQAEAEAETRLVEQYADRAVLEVRCPCGRVTYVECRWQVPVDATGPVPPTRKPNP